MTKNAPFVLCWILAAATPALGAEFEDHVFSGNKFVQEKKYKEAAREYQTAIEMNPQSADANLLLGLTLANTKDLDGALRYTQASLLIKPSYSGYYNLGLIQANLGKYAESVDAYQKAVGLNTSSYQAWYQLGLVYSTDLKFDKAIEAYQKVISLNPQFAGAYQGLGSASYWNEDTATANAQVQKLRELKLDNEAKQLEAWIKDKEAKKTKAAKKAAAATSTGGLKEAPPTPAA